MNLKLFVIVFLLFIPAKTSAIYWGQTNGPYGGIIYTMAKQDSVLFAGGFSGVYRSNDYGQNWNKCILGNVDKRVWQLIVANNCVFASTEGGIFRSCDHGISWVNLYSGNFHAAIIYNNKIFFSGSSAPTDRNYVTSDYGTTWSTVPDLNFHVRVFAKSKTNIYAAGDSGRVFTSIDSGQTWLPISGYIGNYYITDMLAISNNLYVSTLHEGIFMSPDNGNTWLTSNAGLSNNYMNKIVEFAGYMFASNSYYGLFKSTNFAGNWNPISNGLYNKNGLGIFVIDSVLVYSCNEGGLYFSLDTGKTWSVKNNGITNTWINSLIETPFGIFAGSNGAGVFKTVNGGNDWIPNNNGITNLTIRALVFNGTNLFAGTSGGGVYISSDSGHTWIQSNSGLLGLNINSIIFDGNNILLAADSRVFISTNQGVTWTQLNAPVNGYVRMAINGSTIYAYNNTAICYSYDHGASWNISPGIFSPVNLIPYQSKMFMMDTQNTMAVSNDSGASWQPYSQFWRAKNMITNNSNFFASWYGVFHSSDYGITWTDISTPALNRAGTYFDAIMLSNNELYLSVGWSGVWKANVSTLIGIDEIENNNISVYPNPSQGNFNIKLDDINSGNLLIYNSIGELISKSKIETTELKIDLSSYPPGIYNAILFTNDKRIACKLLISR